MMVHPFQRDQVAIQDGWWTEENSLQVKDITQCGVIRLYLNGNHRSTVVKEIAHINFIALTCISVGGNTIQSIEGLVRVQMTHIEMLGLGENSITSVGVIRKAVWPKFSWLNIVNNYFGDAKKLVQGYFPQMQELLLYWAQEDGKVKNRFTEQCFAGKMEAGSLKYLSIHNKFCFQRSIKRVLKQKWSDAQNDFLKNHIFVSDWGKYMNLFEFQTNEQKFMTKREGSNLTVLLEYFRYTCG